MNMIKIGGLLNLNALYLFEEENKNFENAVNAAYKMSEDKVDLIVIYGKTFTQRKSVYKYLKKKMDITVIPSVSSEKQFAQILDEKLVFSEKHLPGTVFMINPKNKEFMRKKISDAILLGNDQLIKIFNTTIDFVSDYTAISAFRMCMLKYKFIFTEEVLSARIGAELCEKLP